MNLNYSTLQVYKTGSTSRNTIKFFPLSKKSNTQKLLFGDNDGQVNCIYVKKGSVTNYFPKPLNVNKPVKATEMFGDKGFVGFGSTIHGIKRKGKNFFKMTTNMTEAITSLSIETPNIWAVGDYVMYVYNENIEKGFYMSPDKINCMTTMNIYSDDIADSIIGCQDRVLRIIKGSYCSLEVVLDSPVFSLCNYHDLKNKKTVIYGTTQGSIGSLSISKSSAKADWVLNGKSSITSIFSKDFTKDGVDDIVIGKDDGTIQIYSFDVSDQPSLVYSKNFNESITGIDAGFFSNSTTEDIICSSFSGKIFGLIDPNNSSQVQDSKKSITKLISDTFFDVTNGQNNNNNSNHNIGELVSASHESKISNLRKQIENLEKKVKESKKTFQKMTDEQIAVSSNYSVKTDFNLDPKNACYKIIIELDIPIEMCALRSNVNVDFVDSLTSNVIISHKKESNSSSNTTFRCTTSTNRIEILLRTNEGKFGTIEVFVIPKLHPKTSIKKIFKVKPLSLHERLYIKPNIGAKGILNSLTIKGSFSISQIHAWLQGCVDGIPEKISTEEITYFFKSTFLGTILSMECRKGEAIFYSDNASTLSIIEESISKVAIEQQTKIDISYDVKNETFIKVLKLIYPKVEYQLSTSEKVKLIEPLSELQMSEENIDFLSESFQDILKNAKKIQSEVKDQSRRLEFLFDIIIRLYKDKWRFKMHTKSQLEKLKETLKNKKFNLEKLISIFKGD